MKNTKKKTFYSFLGLSDTSRLYLSVDIVNIRNPNQLSWVKRPTRRTPTQPQPFLDARAYLEEPFVSHSPTYSWFSQTASSILSLLSLNHSIWSDILNIISNVSDIFQCIRHFSMYQTFIKWLSYSATLSWFSDLFITFPWYIWEYIFPNILPRILKILGTFRKTYWGSWKLHPSLIILFFWCQQMFLRIFITHMEINI